MTTDDLSTPLGQGATRKRRRLRLPFTATQMLAVLFGVFLVAFCAVAIFTDNPLGGEPSARVAINGPAAPVKSSDKAAKPDAGVAPAAPPAASVKALDAPGQRTITIIDGSSGTRHDVVVSDRADETASPPGSAAPAADVAPMTMGGIDARLLEKSRYGMIPVAAADGTKPFTAYAAATDADRARAAAMPSIAIVVGGLGVGAAKTAEAIAKLPGAVTLAFTPYGVDPGKNVERARAQRHEILLQIPMEPFDYPDNDPGPQTLLTSATSEQNIDRLYWHLSRFQGYVGIANFMGARFIATDEALRPVLRDAAKRGLGFLDDGGSSRSAAAALAGDAAMPFARGDLTIDATPTAAEIDRALAKLEAIAKERGVAVGIASALPVSIERLGTWAKQLQSRGILLVPLTTAMLKSKSG